MVIKKIIFKNILTYHGVQTLELPANEDSSLTVIVGPNNSGKTSIIRALKFWFYGEDGVPKRGDIPLFLSNKAKAEVPVGSTLTGWVEVTFERTGFRGKETICLRRILEIKRASEDRWTTNEVKLEHIKPGSRPIIEEDKGGRFQRMIEGMVPRLLFDAFYFKGEPLDGKLLGDVGSIRDALGQFLHEDQLRSTFPRDAVTEVKTGVRGADIILEVINDVGTACGRILFETKRTQDWSNNWIGKLREDMHLAKAHVAVIITQQLPKDIQSCGFKDGVWVSDFTSAMTLIRSLRWGLMQVQLEKKVHQHADENAALLYGYVTSPEFRNRVVSIVGAHAKLRDGINDERKAMEKNWKRRETQIGIVETNIMAMLGSIEGNSGHRLEGVGELELENGEDELLEDAE